MAKYVSHQIFLVMGRIITLRALEVTLVQVLDADVCRQQARAGKFGWTQFARVRLSVILHVIVQQRFGGIVTTALVALILAICLRLYRSDQ